MANVKKSEIRLNDDNILDLEERLNDLELQMIEATEFSHISSEAFETLQTQITELKQMFESLLSISNTSPTQEIKSSFSEYI